MNALPNPFSDFNSQTTGGWEEPAAVSRSPQLADTAAGTNSELAGVASRASRPGSLGIPGKKDQAPNSDFADAKPLSADEPTAVANAPWLTIAAVGINSESAPACGHSAGDTGETIVSSPAAFPAFPEDHIPELISCARQPHSFVDMDALYKAIVKEHPRDLDLEPPPLFLRKPSSAFLRAISEFSDALKDLAPNRERGKSDRADYKNTNQTEPNNIGHRFSP